MPRAALIATTAITITALLQGCGGLERRVVKPQPLKTLEAPRYSAQTGDILITSNFSNLTMTLRTDQEVQGRGQHRDREVLAKLPPCRLQYLGRDKEGGFFTCPEPMSVQIGEKLITPHGGLYVPIDRQRPHELFWRGRFIDRNKLTELGQLQVHVVGAEAVPATYPEQVEITPVRDVGPGFVSTLTFLGVASGKIQFAYREFSDRLARPAFSQDLQLDYVKDQAYSFKSARFIVHRATVNEIEITLLAPL